jgi:serine/threonine-protein kinase HipA
VATTKKKPPADTVARIALWGHAVGAVAELADGSIVFEYEPAFRRSGLEISPIKLPLSTSGPVSFPELARVQSFGGLPGVLADSLPDAFGNAIIKRYFEQRGTPNAAFSPVQKLLYIGRRAMGALEFLPPLEIDPSPDAAAALEVARLVDEARRVIAGDLTVVVPELMQSGASAGGARAKATILWNRDANEVRSAFVPRNDGDQHWIIKFDGVSRGGGGHGLEAEFKPGPWGRIEYAYSVMARAAGIEMAETHLLREREFAHFMTKRFDRLGDERVHKHSLAGLHHIDYNVRGGFSYEGWFRTIRELRMDQRSVDEAFRRMAFNLAARNQDDHVKNFDFLMDREGAWRLSPAFDLTWAMEGQWARTHQMTLRGRDDGFTRTDLLAVGKEFDVAKNGAVIIDEVLDALNGWTAAAKDAELDAVMTKKIRESFRDFR